MHTVEMIEQLVGVAEQLGYEVRHEYLGGTGGGACEFSGRKWIFVDLALNSVEQLDQLTSAIRNDAGVHLLNLTPSLAQWLHVNRAA